MKITVLDYPVFGFPSAPAWVSEVKGTAAGAFLDPREPFSTDLLSALDKPLGKRRAQLVRRFTALPSELQQPIQQVPQDYFLRDSLVDVVVFRNLYVLLRADLLILDANNVGIPGETFVLATWAQILGIPILTVSDQVVVHPQVRHMSSGVVSSHTVPYMASKLVGRRPLIPVVAETTDGTSNTPVV